jgi:hypothetical protein
VGYVAIPNRNLKSIFDYLGLSNIEVAKSLHYDPSLISRYLSGQRHLKASSPQLDAIAELILARSQRVRDVEWLTEQFVASGLPTEMATVYRFKQNLIMWLATDGDTLRHNLSGDSRKELLKPEPTVVRQDGLVCAGTLQIAMELQNVLGGLPRGTVADMFLSSDQLSTIVDADIIALLMNIIEKNDLRIRMVVCVTANTQAMSLIVSGYMGALVSGHVQLSVVHGMTQTVTNQLHLIVPNKYALLVTETTGRLARAVATAVRDAEYVQEMESSFGVAWRYAQPILNIYDDHFTRNVIEVFYTEFCTPGALDIIKDNLNPMYMKEEEYFRFLATRGHSEEELVWRCSEYHRFKVDLHINLKNGELFREVLSLKRLDDIARRGVCRMAGNYFMENGFVDLDTEGCLAILEGYAQYMETYPNFQLLILDDFATLNECSCWHIKQNHHIGINYWKQKEPVMVYSDQLMLLREFQTHFDKLWSTGAGAIGNQLNVVAVLRDVARRMRVAHG